MLHESFGFPPTVHDDVEGLLYLGYLEESFDFCGHRFTLRTLRGEEELLAGLVCKEYQEVVGQDKALAWATIGLALVEVDGDEDFCPPVSRDKKEFARARFQYVTGKWFWPLGARLWREYANLLTRQAEAVSEMGDFFERSLLPDMPFADSLTDKGDSELDQKTEAEIMEFLDDLPDEDSTPS
jgi:hypothetical protein